MITKTKSVMDEKAKQDFQEKRSIAGIPGDACSR